MVVAVLIVTGFLALLFYVMYLVKPKRVRLTAKVFKIVEFNVEADSASGGVGAAARRDRASGRQSQGTTGKRRESTPGSRAEGVAVTRGYESLLMLCSVMIKKAGRAAPIKESFVPVRFNP